VHRAGLLRNDRFDDDVAASKGVRDRRTRECRDQDHRRIFDHCQVIPCAGSMNDYGALDCRLMCIAAEKGRRDESDALVGRACLDRVVVGRDLDPPPDHSCLRFPTAEGEARRTREPPVGAAPVVPPRLQRLSFAEPSLLHDLGEPQPGDRRLLEPALELARRPDLDSCPVAGRAFLRQPVCAVPVPRRDEDESGCLANGFVRLVGSLLVVALGLVGRGSSAPLPERATGRDAIVALSDVDHAVPPGRIAGLAYRDAQPGRARRMNDQLLN